jgi:hypothetical protein
VAVQLPSLERAAATPPHGSFQGGGTY